MTVEDMSPQESEVQRSALTSQETSGTMLVTTGSQDEKDTGSESADESISSATYSNLGKRLQQLRTMGVEGGNGFDFSFTQGFL